MKDGIVAIVGRPNVGKSTLFNRFVSKRMAIVDDRPGVTRDRLYSDVVWQHNQFILIDTGGLVPESHDGMEQNIRLQVELALDEADVILFMVDGRSGLVPLDREIAQQLQKMTKSILLIVNKADSATLELEVHDFFQLGLGEPIPVSAMEGRNIGDLLDTIVDRLPALSQEKEDEAALKLAIVGKPNVGKSSLLNALLGEERVIVAETPGTTRDAIDTHFKFYNQEVIITDTAGIRKKRRAMDGIEFYSMVRSLRAINRCDVALIMTDARDGITRQDLRIMEETINAGRGIILLINKWDLVEKDDATYNSFRADYREKLGKNTYIPLEFISVRERQRIQRPIEMALKIKQSRATKIKTSALNDFIEKVCRLRSFFTSNGKEIKIYYATQVGTAPPSFIFFTNFADEVKDAQKRFMENNFRDSFEFEGTPLNIMWRNKS